jgi:hypothetical protein
LFVTEGKSPAQKPSSLTQRRSSAAAALGSCGASRATPLSRGDLAGETVVKPVVVSLGDRRGPGGQLNHSDGQCRSRIEDGTVDAVFILKTDPRFGVRVFALAFARQTALPAVGVEHRPGGVPVHLRKVSFDVSKDVLVVFHDVAVRIDNKFCHCASMILTQNS